METIVGKRLDLDYLAYEPAVMYMNGVYYGIQNLRETSGKDLIYSNYGLDDSEINLLETWNIPYDTSYLPLSNYISQNDITQQVVYNKVGEMMDIDNFMNYMISEIYFGNTDWPNNNVKIWKKKAGGKWRWILYDTDFGYNLYDTNLYNHNTLSYALGEKTDKIPDAWSTLLFRRLILNETFRNKFIDRFCIQLSSTFKYDRVKQIMDSLSNKIVNEISYHKTKWPSYRSFTDDLNNMKLFGINRPTTMFIYLSSRFINSATSKTVNLTSNVSGSTYKMNSESIIDSNISLVYFNGKSMNFEAQPLKGYLFKQWELSSKTATTIIPMGSEWKYFDGSAIPAANWTANSFSDTAWKTGNAPLGYVLAGVVTTIGYGGVSSNKYPTAYFRKTISINNLTGKNNFTITALADDGIAIYVNGTEVGRNNMPVGALLYTTLASTTNNGVSSTYSVPENLLKEGNNVIAVEVHQGSVTSSDLIFDLQLSCQENIVSQVITNSTYSFVLTSDINLKAVYEMTSSENPDENLNDIVLNELVASNNLISDEFGEKDDYIELYNKSNKNINIAGWYLTDTPTNRKLSKIPATDTIKTNIPPLGRVVLWADSQPEQGVLHLGFKLGKEGETIILSKDAIAGLNVVVDSVSFPAMNQNMSYSRVPDGSKNWIIQGPTFDKTNDDLSAIEKLQNTSVLIYPTLVSTSFTIQNAIGNSVIIIDLTGKTLYTGVCRSYQEIIQVGFLQRGLYVVRVGINSSKIVKL